MKRIIYFLLFIVLAPKIIVLTSGCAQVMAPTGGPKDSLPPVLVNANPDIPAVNFKGNRINLYFDEFVQVQELQQNLLVSPTPKYNPYIDHKLKSVTIRLRDTLEPNTTYTINLGNSIRDINENNVLKDFRYVFSTGATIDSSIFSGKVKLAETGNADSTLIVLLYKNLADSAVEKQKPKYIARLDSLGNFSFQNLAPGVYRVFALKDNDGSRTYNIKTELFAFADSNINVNSNTTPVLLHAYPEEKDLPKATKSAEKKLIYTAKVRTQKQDVLTDLSIEFNRPLKNIDRQKIFLTDTLNNAIKDVEVSTDSTSKILRIKTKWVMDAVYKLTLAKDFAADSAGVTTANADTIRFRTKAETDYGILILNFSNLAKDKNPVLQFVQNEVVVSAYPLTSERWSAPLLTPANTRSGSYMTTIKMENGIREILLRKNSRKKPTPFHKR